MNQLSSRNNRLKFIETSRELPMILEKSIEDYTSNEWKQQIRKMSTCNQPAGSRFTRTLTDSIHMPKNFPPRHWIAQPSQCYIDAQLLGLSDGYCCIHFSVTLNPYNLHHKAYENDALNPNNLHHGASGNDARDGSQSASITIFVNLRLSRSCLK